MPRAQMPGGGRRIDDDTVRFAMLFAGAILLVFFLLVARLWIDQRQGRVITLKPVRNRADVIRRVLHQR